MVHGEYLTKDPKSGLWVPHSNVFTLDGWEEMLDSAFQDGDFAWDVGLCNATYAPDLLIGDVEEPGAVNGYARQNLDRGLTNWPLIARVGNQVYVESREFTFTATGAYDTAVSRMFMVNVVDKVMSISSQFEAPVTFSADSQHKYRLYFR